MFNFKKITAFVAFFLFTSTAIFAQGIPQPQQQAPDIGEVSDSELQLVIDLFSEIQPIQEATQMKMIEKVEDEGMEVQRFTQIMSALQQGMDADAVEASEDEMKKFEEINEVISKMQEEADDAIVKIIEDSDMGLDRFQNVTMAIQTDPEIQARYIELLEASEENQG